MQLGGLLERESACGELTRLGVVEPLLLLALGDLALDVLDPVGGVLRVGLRLDEFLAKALELLLEGCSLPLAGQQTDGSGPSLVKRCELFAGAGEYAATAVTFFVESGHHCSKELAAGGVWVAGLALVAVA